MNIIGRAQWGARYGDGIGWTSLPVRELWLHHSVTIAPDLIPPFSDDDAAIRTIDRIGAERFGWNYGFPYTFGVTPVGRVYAGHHINKQGAHTGGRNSYSRAICLVGNYERDDPPDSMLRAVAWLVRHGYEHGWWQAPKLNGGHRDVKATACPGIKAYRQIDNINRMAAQPMEDDVDVNESIGEDWAGNEQTWKSWMNNLDKRVYEIHRQETHAYDYDRHHNAAEDNQYGHTLATRNELHAIHEQLNGKLDDILTRLQE